MELLEKKIVQYKSEHAAKLAIIWLHGLGADYTDFLSIPNELNLSMPVKFVFPNAPMQAVTINGGTVMRAWYDILDFDLLHNSVDRRGIQKSVEQIKQLILQLIAEGFAREQIIVAGFSQGGVISYYTGLNHGDLLAGVMILSAYLPESSLSGYSLANSKLPFLITHGNFDPIIPVIAAHTAQQLLSEFGFSVELHTYNMAHNLCSQQISDIRNWIEQHFSCLN